TWGLILANLVVFGYELSLWSQGRLEEFIYTYGAVPARVSRGEALHTLLTSMFIHAGFLHILGNMLYLYIFGDNVEDMMGRRRYLAFYFFSGMVAMLAQVAVHPQAEVPGVGASGAIAGVLGAYFITYPGARVRTVLILGIFIRVVYLPAALVLGFWFLLQVLAGVLSLGEVSEAGGVAYFAHAGGFAAGMLLAPFLRKR
ncbi:MAG: rhomboid family intramembrane serine protease, partial [Euryarchaeota archaeon]|nr:rhomboid family intramembrane serine protease [Euryarchaeota archaeon]